VNHRRKTCLKDTFSIQKMYGTNRAHKQAMFDS
jgi:hypothetical protein